MIAIRRLVVLLSALGASACASSSAASRREGPPRWLGNFRTPQLAATATMGSTPSARAASYGAITLTPVEQSPGRLQVDLSVTVSAAPGAQLAWAVFSGSCGAPTPPVSPLNEFPTIDVANSGSGRIRTEMAMPLEPHESYHANVYESSRATDVSNVLMCANLDYSGRR